MKEEVTIRKEIFIIANKYEIRQKKNILTNRQIEYPVLISFGCKNKEVAKILCVANSTVKKTFEEIFRKIGAKIKI